MQLDELSYIRIGTHRLEEWRVFGEQVLGAMATDGPNGSLHLKLDEWAYRIALVPYDRELFLVSGWSVRNAAAYEAALAHAMKNGAKIEHGTPEECSDRLVAAFFRMKDPAGNTHEICWGRTLNSDFFNSPVAVSGFVTGDLGFGHVVLPCHGDFEAALDFYRKVMGLEYSDYFSRDLVGDNSKMRVYFHHCNNGRQHSLAIGEFSSDTGLNHFMMEVRTLDDVGRALDRCLAHGVPVARSLGKHVNDSVVSFYMTAPSGFQIEYGCGGAVMDWSAHKVTQIPVGSHWGHAWLTKPSTLIKPSDARTTKEKA